MKGFVFVLFVNALALGMLRRSAWKASLRRFAQPRMFCRGFAFIEFVTKQEAKNAMESIAGAHLYGRRLVVEWAEQGDEGLDEIRAKTAAKFRGEDVDTFDDMPAKRRKTNV